MSLRENIYYVYRQLGYLPTSIVKVCKGKSKYHLGYQWKYLFNY